VPFAVGLDIKHEGRDPSLGAAAIAECLRDAETAGFESGWTNEDVGYDAFSVLSAASQRTQRIRLGTAIVNVYVRSPMLTAMAAATLDELSGGRAMLGLSIGHHPWNDLGHGIPIEAPLARLRESVAIIRAALGGEAFTHDGRSFRGISTRLETSPRPDLPIHVAGNRPGIVRIAAETADGLLTNVVPASFVANEVAGRLRDDARSAGRNPDAIELTTLVTCCVDDDRERAISAARRTFVYRIRNTTRLSEVLPGEHREEVEYLHRLVRSGRRDQAEAEASEALVTTIVNAGSPREVWGGLQRYGEAGCTRVVAVAYPRSAHHVHALIAALGPYLRPSPT
jgi:alkanesulfonate monooxygenase SsuD/methylene tetrahydromethanopterin reductase-like flavin-dependent oxidoreductase (luciferase family)